MVGKKGKIINGKMPLSDNGLFKKVVAILENARVNVVRSINNNMVVAYWLIGREIVQELQKGKLRADYGKGLIANLSKKLTDKYGGGFSTTNLWYFRQFYLTFRKRNAKILHPTGGESVISHSVGDQFKESRVSFHPNLSWSHYRALMRVKNDLVRNFYETESVRCGWDKRALERQISTLFYERLLKSKNKQAMIQQLTSGGGVEPVDVLKDPYILEFLNLPDIPRLHESKLEEALITNLRQFLLELGKGFSFIGRQKQLCIGRKNFYIDLVFYNYLLKCFVLIDLKVGELTHQDIGQMDGYVRMFEECFRKENDNPTIGLILCSDKDDAIAHYSVLKDSKQLFASKYMLYLPTEDELKRELELERARIEGEKGLMGGESL